MTVQTDNVSGLPDTTVSVRVGTAGSNVGAKFIHDKIEANLKK